MVKSWKDSVPMHKAKCFPVGSALSTSPLSRKSMRSLEHIIHLDHVVIGIELTWFVFVNVVCSTEYAKWIICTIIMDWRWTPPRGTTTLRDTTGSPDRWLRVSHSHCLTFFASPSKPYAIAFPSLKLLSTNYCIDALHWGHAKKSSIIDNAFHILIALKL